MNSRVNKLRTESQNAIPEISAERALLITEFYKSDLAQSVSIPVKRALALKHLLSNKKLYIGINEILIGFILFVMGFCVLH